MEKWDEEPQEATQSEKKDSDKRLACLDDIMNDIELSSVTRDPWKDFPALRALLLERVDWDTGKPMISIDREKCFPKLKPPCTTKERIFIGPKDVQSGEVFDQFTNLWKEENEPLRIKKEQLQRSFWETKVPNTLNRTWE